MTQFHDSAFIFRSAALSERYTKAAESLSAETADVNGLADRNLMDVPILRVSSPEQRLS